MRINLNFGQTNNRTSSGGSGSSSGQEPASVKSGNGVAKQETVQPAALATTLQRSDSGNNILQMPQAMDQEANQRRAQARNLIRQEVKLSSSVLSLSANFQYFYGHSLTVWLPCT